MSLLNILFIIVLMSSNCYSMEQNVQSENSCLLFLKLPHDLNAEILHLILPNPRFSDPLQALKDYKQALFYLRVNKQWRNVLQQTWIVKQQIEYLHSIVHTMLSKNAAFFNSFCPDYRDYISVVTQYKLLPLVKYDLESRKLMVMDDLYLIKASAHNALNILKFLLDNHRSNFDINLKVGGITLLYSAVHNNAYDAAKLLLAQGSNVNVKSIKLGLSPLHSAAENNSVKLAQLLITHKANINSETKSKATPLHYAVFHKSYEVAQLLLKHGAKMSIKTNYFNKTIYGGIVRYYDAQTPLEIAEIQNDEKMSNLLKSYQKKCIIQ